MRKLISSQRKPTNSELSFKLNYRFFCLLLSLRTQAAADGLVCQTVCFRYWLQANYVVFNSTGSSHLANKLLVLRHFTENCSASARHEMMRKRTYENSAITSRSPLSGFIKDDLLILQPACKLQDLQIQDTIEEVLRTNLQGVCFTSWDSDALSQIIRQKLRSFQHQFADFTVVVLIGQANDTGIEKASHKVWKPEYDSFASAWYKNDSLFAVGTVFATYATRNF